ncbi:MAG: ABC transporter ATP-binding protein [Chloroflexales bacterium]|nr:ABC transporter ATP-binding protein [Chloroflexales bacterium]
MRTLPASAITNGTAPRRDDVLLDAQDMRIYYTTTAGEAKVVDGVNLAIRRDEIFGLAGESGCGKSTLVEGLLRLIKPPGYLKSGRALFYPAARNGAEEEPADVLAIDDAHMRRLRWRHIAYVPQGAMNALNPVMRRGDQVVDAILAHSTIQRREAIDRMLSQLRLVGLPPHVANQYPHELSGGMKQRVTIASSVSLSPDILLADEPTTALDVNIQQIILQELKAIREQLGLTIVYVSHDMAVHAELADRMGIMYAGEVMEVSSTLDIFKRPLHPYTQGLIKSIPRLGGPRQRLEGIPGLAPSPLRWPPGCKFHPRCPFAMEVCKHQAPRLREVERGRQVACHLYDAELMASPGAQPSANARQ